MATSKSPWRVDTRVLRQPDPEPPRESWWLCSDDATFSERARQEQARMKASKEGAGYVKAWGLV